MIEQNDHSKQIAQTAALEAEEEQKKRRSQSAEMGNPAQAQLGANIRPDVGSGPAGLETRTTQKSAIFRAVDAVLGLFSRRQTEEQVMTLNEREREATFLIARAQAGGDKGAEEARTAYATQSGAERADIAREYIKAGMKGLTISKELAFDLGEEIGVSFSDSKSIYLEVDSPLSANEYKGLTHHEAMHKRNAAVEREWAASPSVAMTEEHSQADARVEEINGILDQRAAQQQADQQQGDGITPPEVAEQTPRTAEERRAAFRESELAHHRERLAEYGKEHGGEQETTKEQGGGLDWGGGIS